MGPVPQAFHDTLLKDSAGQEILSNPLHGVYRPGGFLGGGKKRQRHVSYFYILYVILYIIIWMKYCITSLQLLQHKSGQTSLEQLYCHPKITV